MTTHDQCPSVGQNGLRCTLADGHLATHHWADGECWSEPFDLTAPPAAPWVTTGKTTYSAYEEPI